MRLRSRLSGLQLEGGLPCRGVALRSAGSLEADRDGTVDGDGAGAGVDGDSDEAVRGGDSAGEPLEAAWPGCDLDGGVGHVGYVGVSHDVTLDGTELFFSGVHLHGGPAPVRRFLPDLVDLIWKRKINPGAVFDLTLPLEDAAEGYRAMDERRATKILLTVLRGPPWHGRLGHARPVHPKAVRSEHRTAITVQKGTSAMTSTTGGQVAGPQPPAAGAPGEGGSVLLASRGLPPATYLLAAGTFLLGTAEFLIAGLLPGIADSFGVSVSHAGLAITVFAVGMIVGAPAMTLLTLRLPRRVTLALALGVFAAGHVTGALAGSFALFLAARFLTALATGAFWAVAAAVAVADAGPAASSRVLGIVLGGGMLANVLGVPVGAYTGQLAGWRAVFWAMAVLSVLTAAAVGRFVPADPADRPHPSVRAELAALRSGRLWLTLMICALVTGGVLSVYSFVSPLLTERAGLPETAVPGALLLFGCAALAGNILGGRLGGTHPYATVAVTAALTVAATAGICLFSTRPLPVLLLFTLLGLAGLSANPVLIALSARFGGKAPTLATAMPTSVFNLGTAIGTGISAAALGSPLRALGPPAVAAIAAALIFIPLGALALSERRAGPAAAPGLSSPGPAPPRRADLDLVMTRTASRIAPSRDEQRPVLDKKGPIR
jgi:predicted MFS family arabinose efflux permease